MLQRQICGACGVARGVDIAYQGKLASTDSPIQISAVFSMTDFLPETHRRTTGHCSQQAIVDLDHLLNCLTGDPVSC